MLKIGIVGHGFVGKAMHRTFAYNAETFVVDPKESDITISELPMYDPDVIFVCLPAPTLDNSTVDATLIYDVFKQLFALNYDGLVVVKSTLPPNTTQDLFDSFCLKTEIPTPLRYIYSPEFLREQEWQHDALHPGRLIFAGNYRDCLALEDIYTKHSHVDTGTQYVYTDYKTASLVKYSINSYLASKVVFMNQLHQLCEDVYNTSHGIHPEIWDEFIRIMSADPRIGDSHTKVPGPDGNYGYGGTCFPKDVKAMNGFDVNGRMSLLKEAEIANTKIRLGNK